MPTPVVTRELRDILIEHIDGPVRINVHDPARHNRVRAAVSAGILRTDSYGICRPTKTFVTEKGRALLAAALADWAEALIRADRARSSNVSDLPDSAANAA